MWLFQMIMERKRTLNTNPTLIFSWHREVSIPFIVWSVKSMPNAIHKVHLMKVNCLVSQGQKDVNEQTMAIPDRPN